jgi:hypothetical protein
LRDFAGGKDSRNPDWVPDRSSRALAVALDRLYVGRTVIDLHTREDFAGWLEEQMGLQDAFLEDLAPLPSELDDVLPDIVRLVFRMQIGGGIVAGEMRRMRELVLRATGVSAFKLAAGGTARGNCCQGAEINEESDAAISFVIDVPSDLRLDCARVEVVEREWDETVPPWFSDREFFATVRDAMLPSPTQWVQILGERGLLVAWRYYDGPPTESAAVPPSYEGWFLQHVERLRSTTGGLVFFMAKQDRRDFRLSVRRDEGEPDSLWRACTEYVATLPNAEIHCGNVVLTGAEWLRHLSRVP